MNEVLMIVLSLSVSASLVGALLMVVKPLYRTRLHKTWQYYIWLVVVVRLLLPFAPEMNLMDRVARGIDRAGRAEVERVADVGPDSGSGQRQGAQEAVENTPLTTEPASPTALEELRGNLWLLWLGVAALLLVRKVTSYHSFARFIRAGRSPVDDPDILDAYSDLCEEMGLRRTLPLYTNSLAVSPMLVGILKPYIVLPGADLGDGELELVLRHELVHYKRGDILYKWLVQVAVCVHWFNPFVYLLRREVAKACELSCDEAVLYRIGAEGRRSYGNTLLSTIKTGGTYGDAVASVTLSEDGKLLKERLEAILQSGTKSRAIVVSSVALALLLVCGAVFAGAYTGARAVATGGSIQQGRGEDVLREQGNGIWADGVEPVVGESLPDAVELHRNAAQTQVTLYENGYLFSLSFTAGDDLNNYEKAIQIECGAQSTYLAFTGDTAAYAADDGLIETIRSAATEIIEESMAPWDNRFFVLQEVFGPHTQDRDDLLRQAYLDEDMWAFGTLVGYAGDAVKDELIYTAWKDGRIEYLAVLAYADPPSTVDFEGLARRAAQEGRMSVVHVLNEYISPSLRQELIGMAVEQHDWDAADQLYWNVDSQDLLDTDLLAESAYRDNQMQWFGSLVPNLSKTKLKELAELAYVDGKRDFFVQMVPFLSYELLNSYAKRSFSDMKYEFQPMLMDYMS